MSGVMNVSEPKKSQKPAAEAGKGKKNVKVSTEFHKRLKMIAASTEKEMGEIIEDEMKEFIARELKRMREAQ